MIKRKTISSMALLALAAFSGSSFAGPPATVADVAWMTGNWGREPRPQSVGRELDHG